MVFRSLSPEKANCYYVPYVMLLVYNRYFRTKINKGMNEFSEKEHLVDGRNDGSP